MSQQSNPYPFVGMLAYSEPALLSDDFLVADGTAVVDPIAYPLVTTILNAQTPELQAGNIGYSSVLNLFVAADSGGGTLPNALGLWYSSNGSNWTLAATFAALFDDVATNAIVYDIRYLNDIFVAVGKNIGADKAFILTSADGIAWSVAHQGAGNTILYGVGYGNGKYIAVGHNETSGAGLDYVSTNGSTWTTGNFTPATTSGFAIAYSDDLTLFAIAADGGKIYSSADDAVWAAHTTDTAVTTTAILWNADDAIFAGVADDGKIYTSADGLTYVGASMDNPVTSFIYSSRLSLYVGTDASAIFTSANTTTWVSRYAHAMTCLVESDSQELIVAGGSPSDVQFATSANGTDWTAVASGIGLQAYVVPQIYTVDSGGSASTFPAFLKLR